MDGTDLDRLSLSTLPGVGPAREERLARLGLTSVRDLLLLVPRGLVRQGGRATVAQAARRSGEECSLRGSLSAPRIFRQGRRSTVSADLADGTGTLRVLFFNQPWILERLRALAAEGSEVELYGRIGAGKGGPALLAPKLVPVERPLPPPGTILPVYPATEGVSQAFLRELARRATDAHADRVDDPLPAGALESAGLPTLARAVRELHRPPSEEAFLAARRRLALERLVGAQARLLEAREARRAGRARAVRLDQAEYERLVASLPFKPTRGQRDVMAEVRADLALPRPMRRLLHGDVGAGKTLVALLAIAAAVRAGGQAALLAPTEILAEQHFRALAPWLAEAGIEAVLLTGSRAAGERRASERALGSGSALLAIGTHALLSERSRFRRLDLVVIDEQQRFGVEAKRSLVAKGEDVHLLLLSATPIPRTLALTLYGDLDLSRLEEKPHGRGRLETRFVPTARKAAMLRFLDERMATGERVFWVCPRIEEKDDEIRASEAAHEELSRSRLSTHGLELVHGRVPADERALRIERFRRGEARLLVGTSIVEVGLDVPEATVMVIEGAERFGLAQLHQLRGRVGRGPRPSWCFLFAAATARERLAILVETTDGFRIAEEDLRRRGMGELAGLRQAGRDVEGLLDPEADLELVLLARRLLRDGRTRRHYLESDRSAQPALV